MKNMKGTKSIAKGSLCSMPMNDEKDRAKIR